MLQGGSLGWVPYEAPVWYQTVKSLKLGEMSAHVQTSQGWHIIQLLERIPLSSNHVEAKRFLARKWLEGKNN